MAKRVRLWASSWIAGATTCRPNSLAARSLAMPARRAVEAGQPRAFGVARDRPPLGVRQVVAEPGVALRERLRMGADRVDAVESSRSRRSRLWRTYRLVSPTMMSGVVRNRSSERVTTPSLEFSTGTTPKSAAPALVAWNTSSTLAQGTLTIDEPK